MLNIRKVGSLISDDDLEYVFRECINSKFIRTNTMYSDKMSKTKFVPDIGDSTINAYAGPRAGGYQVTLLGGLVNWAGHFGFIKTLHDMGMPLDKVVKLTEWTRIFFMTTDMKEEELTENVTFEMLDKVKMDFAKYRVGTSGFDERWRSNTLDIVMACVAHEIGHICLGHADDPGYDGTVMSSNRNIERQADLFSCSIIQCGTGVSTKGVGVLMLLTSLYCLSPEYDGSSTHPASSERVENMITSFKGVISASDVEMTRKMVNAIAKAKKPKQPKPKKPKDK